MSDLYDPKRLMIDLIALPIIDRAAEGTVDPMETKETGENRKPGGPANSIWKLFLPPHHPLKSLQQHQQKRDRSLETATKTEKTF